MGWGTSNYAAFGIEVVKLAFNSREIELPCRPPVSFAGFQVDQFPDMTIRILTAVSIHDPLILRVSRNPSARSHSLLHEVINSCPALTGQADKHLGVLRRVTDRLVRKGLEEIFHQKHRKHVIAKNHTRGLVIRKLWVQPEPKAFEESVGTLEIPHWKIHVDLSIHNFILCQVLFQHVGIPSIDHCPFCRSHLTATSPKNSRTPFLNFCIVRTG